MSVANTLREVFREEDIVARIGGDEFCILLPNVGDRTLLEKLAKRCLNRVGTSVEKDGVRATFGISLGIATYPQDGRNAKTLLESADTAMYHAKKNGKNTFTFFEDLKG